MASLLRESSDSEIARTNPEKAYVLKVPVATPLASTSAMLIWTEAWSLAWMMFPVAELIEKKNKESSMSFLFLQNIKE